MFLICYHFFPSVFWPKQRKKKSFEMFQNARAHTHTHRHTQTDRQTHTDTHNVSPVGQGGRKELRGCQAETIIFLLVKFFPSCFLTLCPSIPSIRRLPIAPPLLLPPSPPPSPLPLETREAIGAGTGRAKQDSK